jgi:hypothetical protein
MQFVQVYRTAARTVWHSWQYAVCADIQNCSTYCLAQLAICSLCRYTELQHVLFGTVDSMQFVQVYRTAARTVWHSWQYAVCAGIQNCSTYSLAQRLLYGAGNMQFVRQKLKCVTELILIIIIIIIIIIIMSVLFILLTCKLDSAKPTKAANINTLIYKCIGH